MELAPSLFRLGGSTLVNSYLVADSTGVTIIDAGLPGYWKQLPGELARMGRSIDDIRGVVLTHGDTDHVGFADRLRRERGVPVYVHAADAPRARGEVSKPSTGWGPVKVGAVHARPGRGARLMGEARSDRRALAPRRAWRSMGSRRGRGVARGEVRLDSRGRSQCVGDLVERVDDDRRAGAFERLP